MSATNVAILVGIICRNDPCMDDPYIIRDVPSFRVEWLMSAANVAA